MSEYLGGNLIAGGTEAISGIFRVVNATSGAQVIQDDEAVIVSSTGEAYLNVSGSSISITNETPTTAFDTASWRSVGGDTEDTDIINVETVENMPGSLLLTNRAGTESTITSDHILVLGEQLGWTTGTPPDAFGENGQLAINPDTGGGSAAVWHKTAGTWGSQLTFAATSVTGTFGQLITPLTGAVTLDAGTNTDWTIRGSGTGEVTLEDVDSINTNTTAGVMDFYALSLAGGVPTSVTPTATGATTALQITVSSVDYFTLLFSDGLEFRSVSQSGTLIYTNR